MISKEFMIFDQFIFWSFFDDQVVILVPTRRKEHFWYAFQVNFCSNQVPARWKESICYLNWDLNYEIIILLQNNLVILMN